MTNDKKSQQPGTDKGEKEPDFEHSLTELEALVARLEKGDLTLDESLEQFQRGVALTRRCQKILDQAQQVVEQLSNPQDESSANPIKHSD